MVTIAEVPKGYKKTDVGVIPKDWDVKPLGELFSFSGGYSASRDQLSDEGYCYLHYGDIHRSNKTYIDVKKEFIDIPKLNVPLSRISSNSLLKDGDIVFVDASEDDEGVSKHIVVRNSDDTPYISGLHTIVAKSKDDSLKNLYKQHCFQMRIVKKQFRFYAVGTKVSGVSKTNIAKIQLPFPGKPEQKFLASALSDIDELIINFDSLIEKKWNIRQGAMQEFLSGKKRLPGFKDKWNMKPLGDMCFLCKERMNPVSSDDNYRCVELEHLSQGTGRLLGFVDSKQQRSQKSLFKKGDVLFGKLRPYLRKFFWANFDGVCSTEIWVLRSKDVVFNNFLYYLSQTDKFMSVANQSIGTKMPRAEWGTVVEIEMEVPPTIKEQSAIAETLSDMDAEIEDLEQKLDKYRMIKQGMMQELLTGKTRLI